MILIIGGLTFFPALALGPIVEHFAMLPGTLYLIEASSMEFRSHPRGARTSVLDPEILIPAIGDVFRQARSAAS